MISTLFVSDRRYGSHKLSSSLLRLHCFRKAPIFLLAGMNSGFCLLIMKARRAADLEPDGGLSLPLRPRSSPSVASMATAAEAAKVMAAKSAVLVEMMEALEERLRLRMADLSDPLPAGSRRSEPAQTPAIEGEVPAAGYASAPAEFSESLGLPLEGRGDDDFRSGARGSAV